MRSLLNAFKRKLDHWATPLVARVPEVVNYNVFDFQFGEHDLADPWTAFVMIMVAYFVPGMIIAVDSNGDAIDKGQTLLTQCNFKLFQPLTCFAWICVEYAGLRVTKNMTAGKEPDSVDQGKP